MIIPKKTPQPKISATSWVKFYECKAGCEQALGRELTDNYFFNLLLAQAKLITYGHTLLVKSRNSKKVAAEEELSEPDYRFKEGYEGLTNFEEESQPP